MSGNNTTQTETALINLLQSDCDAPLSKSAILQEVRSIDQQLNSTQQSNATDAAAIAAPSPFTVDMTSVSISRDNARSPIPRPSSQLYRDLAAQLDDDRIKSGSQVLRHQQQAPIPSSTSKSSRESINRRSPPVRQSPPRTGNMTSAAGANYNKRAPMPPAKPSHSTMLNPVKKSSNKHKAVDNLLSQTADRLREFQLGGTIKPNQTQSQHAASSTTQLDALKYAQLIDKLDNLSALHRQVLTSENERVQSRLSSQTIQRQLAEAEKLRQSQQTQFDAEKQTSLEMYNAMRQMYEKMLLVKEASYQQSLKELLQRESQHNEYQRQVSCREKESLQLALDERARLHSEHGLVRADLLRTIELLQQEKSGLQQQLTQLRTESELKNRQLLNLQQDHQRLELQHKDLSERNKSIDELQAKIDNLTSQLRDRDDDDERRARQLKAERCEMDRRENLIKARMKSIDEQEDRRRMLLKERRDFSLKLKDRYGLFDNPQEEFPDSAWASGPLRRSDLQRD